MSKPITTLVTKELTIENTSYCGAKCMMCPRDEYFAERKWTHMTMEMFQSVVHQGVALGMESLDACGFGDPFFDPNYKAKLAWVRQTYPKMKIYTSTTGHMLLEQSLDWVCESVDTLKISNFGMTKEIYEKVHKGSLKYDKIHENLLKLVSRPDGKKPYIIFLFIVFPENEHQIEEWKAFWEPKVDEVMVWLPHNYSGSNKALSGQVIAGDAKAKSCGRPVNGNLFVRANGDVSMCCFDFNHKLLLGDLKKESLKDILMGKPLADLRTRHEENNYCGVLCGTCDQVFSRDHALLYATNKERKPGVLTSHPDLINDMLVNT